MQYICGNPINGKYTIARQLFAILTLVDRPSSIMEFQKARIFDKHLPFQSNGSHPRLIPNGFDLTDEQLNIFDAWTDNERDLFRELQWWLLSPVFIRIHDQPPRFLSLHDRVVLPWKERSNPDDTGGHSYVHRVTVHEAHFKFEGVRSSKELFEHNVYSNT